jgi:hypothetical protein
VRRSPSSSQGSDVELRRHRNTQAHVFSIGDRIVGILATDIRALVWSLDKDFEGMAKLKLIQLYS